MELEAANADALTAHARALGWLPEGSAIKRLEPAGDGNMNHTLRAWLDNDAGSGGTGGATCGATLILKQSVPWVAKYPDIAAPVERLDVEAAFYEAVAGEPALAAQMPQLLGYDRDHHLLALSDLGSSADLTTLYATAAPEAPDAALLRWLSALHALPVPAAAVFENRAMRALNHTHIFEVPLTPDNGVTLEEPLAAVAKRFADDGELAGRARTLGEIYLGRQVHGGPAVLLHGDFYPGSWLGSGDGSVNVIDPEFAFRGPAEFDLGVFCAHRIMSGLTPAAAFALLEHYHSSNPPDDALLRAFAAMEVIRRLLGVAQLPLSAATEEKLEWLGWAKETLCA